MSDAGATGAQPLPSSVGIWGVTALLVGNAISIPIFVLPGPLAGDAGPSVVLAICLAAIPAAFVVLYNALLGSAMPVAGGLYVYMSRLTAPFWGFLVPFTIPLIAWAGLVFTAIGFASYASVIIDIPALELAEIGLPELLADLLGTTTLVIGMEGTTILIYLLLLFVFAVNLFGIRLVAQVQLLFFAGLLVSLAAFILPGATAIEPANFQPFFVDYGAFGVAAVSLFYPFLGFGLLVELGEEIQDATRTIPLVLGIGIAVVALVYVALIVVLVGVQPYTGLGTEQDLAIVATQFLPDWGQYVVAAGAVFAVITTVNTTLLVTSRTMMRASRDEILPRWLSRIHPRFQTPHNAIIVLGLPPFLLVPFLEEVVILSMFMSLASLTAYFFCAIGLWNLPRAFPEHYERAPFRLRQYRGLLLAVLGGAIATGMFWFVSLSQEPIAGIVLIGWFMVGYGYYRYRLASRDPVTMYRRMTALDVHEQVGGDPDSLEDD